MNEVKNATGRTIFVLQRGWVVVGIPSRDGDQITLGNASVVRRWGTSAGLGELAQRGPMANTVLDPAPAGITFHGLGVVCEFPCDDDSWMKN
jgi:hypothetical protein